MEALTLKPLLFTAPIVRGMLTNPYLTQVPWGWFLARGGESTNEASAHQEPAV